MSNQIQTQAAKVWQILTAPTTSEAYVKTGQVTWILLKETAYLSWLTICLALVAGDWIWKTGYQAGWNVRNWVNDLEKPSSDRLFSETGKSLLDAGKTAALKAISAAKGQLGIEDKSEPASVSAPAATVPEPATPEPVKAEVPAPATPEPTTSAPTIPEPTTPVTPAKED
jgi:hypothetical protein